VTCTLAHGRTRRRQQSRSVSCDRDQHQGWILEYAPASEVIASVALRKLLEPYVCREDRIDRPERSFSELPVRFDRSEGGGDGVTQLERRREKCRFGGSRRQQCADALGFTFLDGPGIRQEINDVVGRPKHSAVVIERDDRIDEVCAQRLADTR
jgi:hypothetical protein